MSDHPEVVVAHPGMLVIIIADALPAGQPQLLVGYDGKQPSVLGTPVAGSQVLQDCHQQGSVEAVPIPCKVTLLLSALKVLCTACILQFVGCWQPGPPGLPPAGLCRSSFRPLQGDIVVVSTECTLYGMHPSVSWVLAARSCRGATSRAL